MLWCGRAVTSYREGLPCPVMATNWLSKTEHSAKGERCRARRNLCGARGVSEGKGGWGVCASYTETPPCPICILVPIFHAL